MATGSRGERGARGVRAMPQVVDHLIERGLSCLVLSEPGSPTPEATARAHRLEPGELVHTELVTASSGPALVAIPAGDRLDLRLVRRALADPDARPATEAEREVLVSGCDADSVPPLSSWLRVPVYLDPALTGRDQLIFPAARPDVLVCVEREQLLKDSPVVVAPLTVASFTPDRFSSSRRALLADDDLRPVHQRHHGSPVGTIVA